MNYDEMKKTLTTGKTDFQEKGDKVECEVCHRKFVLRKKWQRFCGSTCRIEYHRVQNAYAKLLLKEPDDADRDT